MKLTIDQIQEITKGAVKVWQQEDGFFRFYRLLETQQEAFIARNANFGRRVISTASIRLDFYTNSRTALVETLDAGPWEVMVNGLPQYYLPEQGRITVSLPQGENRITVMLSNHKPTTLKFIQLDEGSWVRPYTYSKKFLFLGDSITQGSTSSRPTTTYANRISRFYDAEVLNWGVGGSRFFPETVEKTNYDPDVVFIAYGTNDYVIWDSMETMRSWAEQYMDRVKELYPNKPVICIGPLWRADGELIRATGKHRDVCDCVKELALAHGFHHLEGYDLIPHSTEYFADGFLHPNDMGFAEYSMNLLQQLAKIL
ncbi:MAG: SGNH/GDSL hydrolase family protein [Oscillospiraceae bacterium]|nr:SGNH/GDSL hydrolase family protein [Oscillospiraceae bacterium]